MVKGTTDLELERAGISSHARRVFIQRWCELLHFTTHDSYAVRLLNSHGALQELLEVVDSMLARDLQAQDLPEVWAEARGNVAEDIILKAQAPNLRRALLELLTSAPKSPDAAVLRRIRMELHPLVTRVSASYLQWILEMLQNAFDNDDAVSAENLAGKLASELMMRRHPDSLYGLGDLLRGPTTSFAQRWATFERVVQKPPEDMTVFLPLPQGIDQLQECADDPGISVLSKEELLARGAFRSDDATASLPQRFAVLVVRTEDTRSAAVEARDRLGEAFDSITLFSRVTTPTLKDWAIVEYDGSRGRKARQVRINRAERWPDASFDRQLVVEAVSRVAPADQSRFRSAIQYYKLGASSNSPGTRFMCDWVALESLVRQSGSIIGDIKRYVPPILCSHYVRNLLGNFLDDCERCEVHLDEVFGVDLSGVSRESAVSALLSGLRAPQSRNAILDACSGHSLLHMRAEQLAGSLGSGQSVASLLDAHEKHLTYHLSRLYRLRNSIVHTGETHRHVIPCTRHLEDYVRRVLYEISAGIARDSMTSISEVLSTQYHNYRMTVRRLKEGDNQPVTVLKGALFAD